VGSEVLPGTVHFLLYFEGKRRISSKKERKKRRKGKKKKTNFSRKLGTLFKVK